MPRTVQPQDLRLADLIRPGKTIAWGQAQAEPLTLTEALMAQRHDLGGVTTFSGIGWNDTIDPAHADTIRFTAYCGAGRNRLLDRAGKLDILALHYSDFARYLAPRIDVLMIQLAPGRSPGSFSFGLACEYLWPLLRSARLVIAEVNENAPSTPGMVEIDAADIDILVPTARPLPRPPEATVTDVHRRIGAHIAGLIEDGTTLQIGLGAIPSAILDALDGHRHLGVHTGLFVGGLTRLIEAGVIDNSRKPIDTGFSVAGLIAGTGATHEMCDGTDLIRLAPTTYTHALPTLAALDRFAAINAALEVDLTGQVNSERAGRTYVGSIGGGTDFARGAAAAAHGLPILALPSARDTRDGLVSCIVPSLTGPVSLARADAGIIVTEQGVADLRGASLWERSEKLLAIAHPDLREDLARQARDGV